MASQIHETGPFEREGTEQVVGGNTPFLLDGADNVWFVKSGRLEVFSVALEDGAPAGTRHHLFTADAGDALFGMDLAAAAAAAEEALVKPVGLLAVGVVGTRLLRMSVARLREAGRAGPVSDLLTGLVDRWVTGLSDGISKSIVPQPRTDVALEPGQEAEVPGGKRARAAKGVVWVRHVDGATLFVGMEEIGQNGAAPLFPLTAEAFIQALGSVRLAACSTPEALGEGKAWEGLASFYAILLRCESQNTMYAVVDERNRLREKAERDRRTREGAVSNLASILNPEAIGALDLDADESLLSACLILGRRLGLHVKAPPKLKEGETHADPLAEICRASKIRARKVLLKGQWWQSETTPLLAQIEEDKRWVAVLPTRPGRYEVHDPQRGGREPLTPALAARLGPKATTFYRSFPEGFLSAWQVFRFGLDGKMADLAWPLALGFIAGMLGLLTPHITGRIVDKVIPEASPSRLAQMATLLASVGIATALLDVARRLRVLRLEIKMSSDVQPAMWDRLINLPSAFFRRFTAGDLAVRVGAVDRIRQVLSAATVTTLMLSLFSVLYLMLLFSYSWKLALLALVLVLLPLMVTMAAAWVKLDIQRQVTEVEGKISGLVLQLLTGISKLRVSGAEGRAFALWSRQFGRQKGFALRTSLVDAAVNVFNSAFPLVATLCLFKLMLYLTEQAIKDGEAPLSIGDFVAFNAAFLILLAQQLQLATAVMSTLTVIPLFDRARPILETRPEVDESKADPGDLTGEIEISRVSFRYQADGPLILDDVSIKIPAGKFVAFVGPSGSGKSTLLRMLLGLDVPDKGAVFYDGRDLSQMDAQRLRRKIGVVIQNGKIRSGSIYENIVGSAPYTLDDAWEAARMAGLDEDIIQMPMAMHTVLQQGGGSLSGGQRQRLMIARAIVSRPRILFFDEATSALDNRTQEIVSQSLQQLQVTRVAIAHRLSTIIGADRIYVIVAGRVVQQGTYAELVAQAGVFADLIKRQVA